MVLPCMATVSPGCTASTFFFFLRQARSGNLPSGRFLQRTARQSLVRATHYSWSFWRHKMPAMHRLWVRHNDAGIKCTVTLRDLGAALVLHSDVLSYSPFIMASTKQSGLERSANPLVTVLMTARGIPRCWVIAATITLQHRQTGVWSNACNMRVRRQFKSTYIHWTWWSASLVVSHVQTRKSPRTPPLPFVHMIIFQGCHDGISCL